MIKQKMIKLEKVDDKTAYQNLLIKYAELENKIADIKANCDLAIEGRDVKIMELEKENAEWEKFVKDIQNRNEENYLKVCHKLATELNRGIELEEQIKQIEKVSDYNADQLTKAKDIIKEYIRFEPMIGTCSFYSEEYEKTKTKARQFLKEIEKC